MKSFLFSTFILLFSCFATAQVGIGTTSPEATLDVTAANLTATSVDGILIPRVTRIRAQNMTSITTSTMIYISEIATGSASGTTINVTSVGFYFYNGTVWEKLATGNSNIDWSLLGNAGTAPATNFLGTTDDVDLVFRRNNSRAGFIGNPNTATGNMNTSFGANSLLSSTGIRNVAIGTNVMPSNGAGIANVAIGERTMFSNTGGNENTAVGVGALFTNSIGNSNTAIGRNALTTNTADFNTAVGDRALNGNTIGTLNTAVGNNSLLLNTQGNNNTAMGVQTLRGNTVGNDNTALGYRALRATTGSSNTAIGLDAGLTLTTGSNNIMIGANTVAPVVAGSDQLNIGNTIFGSMAGVLTAGVNTSRTIGINVTAPQGALDITSTTDGILIPRIGLADTATVTVSTGTTSEIVYNTATIADVTPGFYYLSTNTGPWVRFNTGPAVGWLTTGNSGLSSATNFLGTTDNIDVAFRRNNAAAGRITNTSTSIGLGAMNGTTTNNAAFGNSAAASTTGARNVAIGSSALQSNIIGDENTAVGNQALLGNTNSLRNTAVGNRAMASLNGSANVDNVAIGWQAMATAASGIKGTFIGYEAGRNTTGNFSTAVGSQALGSNNGGPSTGIDNTAIGNQALSFNLSGQQNTAVGKEAMATTTTASNSTAVGYGALRNFQGATNTAVGYQAGFGTGAGSTGTNNVFMGFQPGFRVTTGSSNVLIGNQAGFNLTTGSSNVILGNFAGDNLTTGIVNTFIGENAGNLTSTGGYNIGIGPNAGNGNTTGANNINIGFQTGNSNNGNNNVNIGHQAGFGNTLGGNVNIGYQAGAGETAANRLYIENSNVDSNSALIYGEFDNNILRVNGTLQVNNPAGVTGYALPNVRGTVNQILRTDGAGGTSWVAASTTETDPKVSSVTNNIVPKWNGTALVDGIMTDDGTTVTVAGTTSTTNFQMPTGATANYIMQSDAAGNASWVNPTSIAITETDPQVSSVTNNRIPKWNSTTTTLEDGIVTDNGTTVSVAGTTSTTNLQMTTGATANYIMQSDAAGNGSWVDANIKSFVDTGATLGTYNISLTEYTIRVWNSLTTVNLPSAPANPGKIFIIIGSNGIGLKNFTTSGGGIYDDVTNTTFTTITGGQRFMVQSDGVNWIVIGR